MARGRTAALTAPAARVFRWGAAARHRRLFHPSGVLATGFLDRVAPADEGLPVGSSPVVARVSKGAGTPGAAPDAVGLALRVPLSQHEPDCWDILLVSAGSGMFGRALGLRPVLSWAGLTMTTLMPLGYREDTWWLRARLVTPVHGYGLALGSMRREIERGRVCFELDQARGTGDFHPLADLVLTGLDQRHDVSFDPIVNTAPGVVLRPRWLAELRGQAYRGSREGRGAPPVTRRAAGRPDA
ncbi:phosphodiesterase [Mycolicibacter senuensis]|uniref:phosphodiesterase n=1 Tax=Mycolicibacter senuensis TaxID=386913 RepID=UPI000DCE08BC|nr:phosphodiesterase [Mycolicibacter senuensis]RAU95354.1 phosphodiesterase [Mycolicibacter senuensis]